MSSTTPSTAAAATRQISDRRRLNPTDTNNNLAPRRIQTGLPGIRRTVYDGALRVDESAYDVLSAALHDVSDDNDGRKDDNLSLQARPEWRKYFPLNALLRPTIAEDSTTNRRVQITQLTNQTVITHQPRIVNPTTGERAMCAVESVQTVARNLGVEVLDAGVDIMGDEGENENNEKNGQEGENEQVVVSLRGGGDGNEEDVVMGGEKEEDVVMSDNIMATDGTGAGEGRTAMTAVENSGVVADVNTDAVGASQSDAAAAATTATTTTANLTAAENVAPVPSSSVQVAGEVQTKVVATQGEEQSKPTDTVAAANEDDKQAVGQADNVANNVPSTEVSAPVATSTAVAVAVAAGSAPDAGAVPAAATSSSGVTTNATAAAASNAASNTEPSAAAAAPVPEATTVKSTTIQPLPSNHPPLSTSISITTTNIPTVQNAPSWFNPTTISTNEKSSLPEWFNSSAPHRTPTTYLSTRNQILNIYHSQLQSNTTTAASSSTAAAQTGGVAPQQQQPQQHYLTSTAIRRVVPGDTGSLLRLHTFLCDWGLINSKDMGENAPSDLALRGGGKSISSGRGEKRGLEEVKRSVFWSKERLEKLDGAVVKFVTSGGGVEGVTQQQQPNVDWEAVAKEIGEGVTASDCQRAFLDPPVTDEVSVKIAKTQPGFDLSTILDGVHPDVLKATVDASLKATNDITEARKASIAGILASTAATKAQSEEEEIARTLMDILDQRMQRLENRVAILDDVEALLEAERVALELERRDMYTTRCRHWFGDGSS